MTRLSLPRVPAHTAVWISALLLCAVGAPSAARAQINTTVRGSQMYLENGGLPISGTERPEDFRPDLLGREVIVSFNPVPAGRVTVEIDLSENYYKQPDKRVMAITIDGKNVQARLDIFAAAGGYAKAITESYQVDHEGGRLSVTLTAISDMAKFSTIRVKDASGLLLARVNAKDKASAARPSDRGPFRLYGENELVFFAADHAPAGAHSTFVYGAKGQWGGVSTLYGPVCEDGVLIGLGDEKSVQIMPFIPAENISANARWFADGDIHRTIRAATDRWEAPGLSWVDYSPPWYLRDFDSASDEEKSRFALPATWMIFTVDNSAGAQPRTFYFGLPVAAAQRAFDDGKFEGFILTDPNTGGSHAFAMPGGMARLLTGPELTQVFGEMDHGFAFAVTVAAGQKRVVPVIVAHYTDKAVGTRYNAKFAYTSLFKNIDDVVAHAATGFGAARARSDYLDGVLDKSGLNPFRKFLAGHSLHTFLANTSLLRTPEGKTIWSEAEGEYMNTNTFDLTVDHVFYDSIMEPWALRNVLNHFADVYNLTRPLTNPETRATGPAALFFNHDMGGGHRGEIIFNPPGQPSGYEDAMGFMGQEQVQNWILSAGIYWSATRDTAWLRSRKATLDKCLESMLLRDDPDPAKRDGLTKWTNLNNTGHEEITTYDSLDHSLRPSYLNGYIAVKSWSAYVVLDALFTHLGDTQSAAVARAQAALTARTIVSKVDSSTQTLPAVFDGKSQARIIPMVEGLAYPYEMGLTQAVSMNGPYGDLIRALRTHLDNVLKPGVCLDSSSGAWRLSSSSGNTWQSKVYLSQFVAEKILGLTGDRVDGKVDQVHATFQVYGCPTKAWSDQLDSSNGNPLGSLHYPRGITSATWWLDAKSAAGNAPY